MGRRGNPYHNAKAESFMKTLKAEAVYLPPLPPIAVGEVERAGCRAANSVGHAAMEAVVAK
jgi:transposase InsO family protein